MESHFGTATIPTTNISKGTISISGLSNGGERNSSLAFVNEHISVDLPTM